MDGGCKVDGGCKLDGACLGSNPQPLRWTLVVRVAVKLKKESGASRPSTMQYDVQNGFQEILVHRPASQWWDAVQRQHCI